MEHAFTPKIMRILEEEFADSAKDVYDKSQLIQYLNNKPRSAGRGSKSRSSFANLYAVYVLVEDYIKGEFVKSGAYMGYEGATFSDILNRQRQLPFGSKLQNHALNSRMNEEFAKFFPTSDYKPILRDPPTNRYWINENLIKVDSAEGTAINLSGAIIRIIDAYVEAKRDAFEAFLESCQKMQSVKSEDLGEVREFIESLLKPTVDARLFEIVSFSILKAYYSAQSIFWGYQRDKVNQEFLILYKTGRTNANDGGIDFVMRPLGRFFQVTETLDVKKYFLDIDKVQKFPLTFVVKSNEERDTLSAKIKAQAERQYPVAAIVERYMSCIEEIINIPTLTERFEKAVEQGALASVMDEIVTQSKVEFNYEDDVAEEASEDISEDAEALPATDPEGELFEE